METTSAGEGRTGGVRCIKMFFFEHLMNIVFTHHAEDRVKIRKITKPEVLDTIRFPDKTMKKHGKYYYQKQLERGTIEVVVEKSGKNLNIITIYWI